MLFTGEGILFTDEDILSRFKERLEGAVHVRIATAWATSGSALDALEEKKGLKVRAIVGTHGNATEPRALERLKRLGKLRLARNAPLFHSKIYVFEFRSGKPVAWIGSANFTGPGFEGGNVETVYETDDVEPFLEWFEQRWGQFKPASQRAIDEYRRRYKKNPPGPEFRKVVGEPKWEPVLDPEEIRGAFKRMRETLIDGAEKLRDRGGKDPKSMYWRTDLEYWCAFRDPADRRNRGRQGYWNGFGQARPANPEDGQALILGLNPPFDGNSTYARSCHGLFVRNGSGDIFLARDLKGIRKGRGVVNPKDLEEGLKKRSLGRVVDVPWREGDPRRMVVLSEVGSGELRKTVAELVRLVSELRDAAGD